MEFFRGITYQIQGLRMAVSNPRLLRLGMIRLLIILLLSAVFVVLILMHRKEIAELAWARPENIWLAWMWVIFSGLVSLILVAVAIVGSFLVSQILFSVWIMDLMSRITEETVSGTAWQPRPMSFFRTFLFLVRQEIPRAMLPVLLMLIVMVLGWFTPFGPILAALSSIAAATFLAWDNTDLTPARRMKPFGLRLKFLQRHLWFHIGFGLLFLIPIANLVFLSFAPVGATLYVLEQEGDQHDRS